MEQVCKEIAILTRQFEKHTLNSAHKVGLSMSNGRLSAPSMSGRLCEAEALLSHRIDSAGVQIRCANCELYDQVRLTFCLEFLLKTSKVDVMALTELQKLIDWPSYQQRDA